MWRSGRQRELQWYSLQLEVIREVKWMAKAQRSSEEQAVWALHFLQQQMDSSLDRCYEHRPLGLGAQVVFFVSSHAVFLPLFFRFVVLV
jgi:hypothetical protein